MCQSCARSESVESDDNVSDSCGVGSTSRYGVAGFSGMIEEASDRVFGGSYAVGPGLTSSECSREPPWLIGCREGSSLGGAAYLTCRQPHTVRGVAGWSAHRIRFVMPLVTCYQGCYRLVGPSRPLYHAASRLLSGVS
ncbi:hypothetical protein BHE74_00039181 [Ensete ventricosum]|nr:hypothetical protein BHE74_00039181 [Ensete ventricosum]